MNAFFGLIAALVLQLLLVVVYVGIMLAVKHLVVSLFLGKPAEGDGPK